MKTIREWFEQDLKDGYRELALKYAIPKNLGNHHKSLKEALYDFAVWSKTPHEDFFCRLAHHYDNTEENPLPPLPLPAEYTLSEAIERMGKEGWVKIPSTELVVYKHAPSLYVLQLLSRGWQITPPCIRPQDFKNAHAELQAAIEACNLLNGAKKETA